MLAVRTFATRCEPGREVPPVKLGLQVPNYTWEGGPPELGKKLGEIARAADAAGYDSFWVMDHFFQIPVVGPVDSYMLEGYTTLAFVAAQTCRVTLGTLVTGVSYRHPGILAKTVTTLDVLSGGRAWLGIGAAWNEREHVGLGVPFPAVRERFERLEETILICLQMWSADNGPFHGKHYRLAETLNSPQSLIRPRPRILIGGGGEKKTLRLVAKYADACNVFGNAQMLRHKLSILRKHCESVGRDYEEIEKTVYYPMDVGEDGSRVNQVVEDLGSLAEAGADAALGVLVRAQDIRPIEIVADKVIAQIKDL
jgi:F420-dependent oxidoreductase-like protein